MTSVTKLHYANATNAQCFESGHPVYVWSRTLNAADLVVRMS